MYKIYKLQGYFVFMSEIRRVLKKGRWVETKKGNFVVNLSREVIKQARPYCKKIEVVGSIRRKEKKPVDIDIVAIPKNLEGFVSALKKKGYKFLQGGDEKSRWRYKGVNVEFYYTTAEEWGAALLAYSSKFGAGIGLRVVARAKGFKLSQHGLFNRRTGKRIAGKTEREIYRALGRPYKEPWNR